jgi:DNA-binding response OmpR family regulator
MKILVVEDDPIVGDMLIQTLSPYYKVELASNGQCGLEIALQFDFDLIILDVMMPELNGIELCRALRVEKQTPIVLLTAKDSHHDRMIGFEAGADDYVCKPFDIRELLARVHALLRRESGAVKIPVLRWGIIHVTVRRKQVLCNGNLVDLTVKEYDILELLLRNPGQVFSRTAILNRLWISDEVPGEETISTHIKCIRKKLREQGSADPIETIYGRGYCLRPLPKADSSCPIETINQVSADWDNQSSQYWEQVASLDSAMKEHNSLLFEVKRPHILIFDRHYQAEILQKQADRWGLIAGIATHEAIADPGIHYGNPTAIVFNLSSYESMDSALLPLTLLLKLRYQSPHSPIFIITHGRVDDQLSFAALGGCKILETH